MWQHGTFYWHELMTRDGALAKGFYGAILGWTFNEMPMDKDEYWDSGETYTVAMLGDTPVAGIFPMHGPKFDGVPEHWMTYIAVDDVDARIETAVQSGGEIIRPVFEVAGIGRIAIIKDPGGAVQGWMTPPKQQ